MIGFFAKDSIGTVMAPLASFKNMIVTCPLTAVCQGFIFWKKLNDFVQFLGFQEKWKPYFTRTGLKNSALGILILELLLGNWHETLQKH